MPVNAFSHYPHGFPYGVTLRNAPVLNTHAGNIWWVNSGHANASNSGGNDGTITKPFSTTAYALTRATANNGDIIVWAPGHTETIPNATTLNFNVAGLTCINLGVGASAATFTVGTAATATVTVSGASTTILGYPIFKAGLDGLDTTITVTGANCHLDVEHQDTSVTVEADIAIAVTGDKFSCNLRDIGFAGGDQRDQSITLNGVDNARINIDFYGKVANSVVDMITVACTDVEVRGTMYVSGTTNGSKNVTDTITGSTWYMDVIDSAAGARYTGGSAAAVASDDISAIASSLLVPTADATANTSERDVVGNKTDAGVTAVGTTKSILAYVKGLITMNTVQTADATNNAFAGDVVGNKTDAAVTAVGTTKTVIAYVKGLLNQIGTLVNTGGTATIGGILGDFLNISLANRLNASSRTATVTLAAADFTGTTTRFTVAGGPILVKHLGLRLSTALPAGANTLKFSFTPTGGGATDLSGATDTASGGQEQLFVVNGVKVTGLVKTTDVGIATQSNESGMPIVLSAGVVQTIFSAGPPASGAGIVYMEYEPLNAAATVA